MIWKWIRRFFGFESTEERLERKQKQQAKRAEKLQRIKDAIMHGMEYTLSTMEKDNAEKLKCIVCMDYPWNPYVTNSLFRSMSKDYSKMALEIRKDINQYMEDQINEKSGQNENLDKLAQRWEENYAKHSKLEIPMLQVLTHIQPPAWMWAQQMPSVEIEEDK